MNAYQIETLSRAIYQPNVQSWSRWQVSTLANTKLCSQHPESQVLRQMNSCLVISEAGRPPKAWDINHGPARLYRHT